MHFDAINLDFYSNTTIITPQVEATEISVDLVENKIDYLDKGFSSGSQPTDVSREIFSRSRKVGSINEFQCLYNYYQFVVCVALRN